MTEADCDIVIIGGGPAGLMAAVAASERGARVTLLEKGDKLGRKLAISGGGRCNVTNAAEIDELIRNIPGNGRFLYSALSEFNNRDIIAFFEGMGIRLKEEDRGRMFPVSDKAQTVVDALVGRVRRQGVRIRTGTPVRSVLYEDGEARGVETHDGEILRCRAVIVATGGKSVPHTGSTGDGYAWAEAAGHTITELYPTEVPLTSAEPFIRARAVQGLSLRGIVMTVWDPRGKRLIEHEGDVLFTHFGLSGPAALRCSQFVVKALKRHAVGEILVTIDLFPGKSADDLYAQTMEQARAESKKSVKTLLRTLLPERLAPLLLEKAGLSGDLTCANIPKQPWHALCRLMKAFPVKVNGTLPLSQAFVTGGGVHLKEIDPRTMQSKKMRGLFFCGEILDIHGYTGGYNITAAFVSGHAAGKAAAALALSDKTAPSP